MPISLTAAQTETQTVGGSTVDTANSSAASNVSTDFGGMLVFTLAKGTPPAIASAAHSGLKMFPCQSI